MSKQFAKVVVLAEPASRREIKGYKFVEQRAQMLQADGLGFEFMLSIRDDAVPFAPGTYFVGARSFSADDYGRVKVGRGGLELITLEEARLALVPPK